MIDLTPLDVRKKRGDFGKGLRGYDPAEVDGFLELVGERMEELVKVFPLWVLIPLLFKMWDIFLYPIPLSS